MERSRERSGEAGGFRSWVEWRAERIEDPDKTSEIKEVIKDGAFYGMVTFDQWLLRLIQEGTVSVADAMQAVSSRHDFELAMQQAGIAVPA